jgi:DNA gyrase subunit B
MDPDRRILLQVTLEDAAASRRDVQHAHGRGRRERRKFIQRNAKDVRFLDI